jgi:uncharacterized membrane protein
MNYHAMLDGVSTADRALIELNLLLLLFVAVVPWPTGLLAEYLREPEGQSNPAAITYGVVMTAMSGAFTLILLHSLWTATPGASGCRPSTPGAASANAASGRGPTGGTWRSARPGRRRRLT